MALFPVVLTDIWSASSRRDQQEIHRIAGSTGCSTRSLLIGEIWPAAGDIGDIFQPRADDSPVLCPAKWPAQCRVTGIAQESSNNSQAQVVVRRQGRAPMRGVGRPEPRASMCVCRRADHCRNRQFLRDLRPLLGEIECCASLPASHSSGKAHGR